MKGPLLLHLLFQGVLLFDALAWEVRMPKDIHGLKGSCLVIPCSYYYRSDPPKNPRRVVWYQWVSRGYPLVYDPLHPKYVNEKFKGKTDLFGNSSWDCSLLIKNLDQVHHGEALYVWIDPENVSWRTYKFYDVTSTILVDATPPQPSIKIYGGVQTGDTVTVVCSTFHTCPYSKPNITLNNIEGSDETDNEHIKDGLWKFSLIRTSITNAENLTIECTVTYYGGITVTAMKSKNAQSPGHEETDVPVPLKPNWLYILVPSLVCVLACILAGVIIYKSQRRQTPGDVQGSEQRVEASLVRGKVALSTGGPELLEGPQRSLKSALAVSTEKLFLQTAVLREEDCPLMPQPAEYCMEDLENPETPLSAGDEGDPLAQKNGMLAE